MKKFLFGLAAIALAVSSCSENEEISSDLTTSKPVMKFTTYTQLATRGVDTQVANLSPISVTAVTVKNSAEEDNYFTYLELTSTESGEEGSKTYSWDYDHTTKGDIYWPATPLNLYAHNFPSTGEGTLSYNNYVAAADPNPASGDKIDKDLKTITFTTVEDIDKQKDIVAATVCEATDDGTTHTVNLPFKHVLSKLTVKASNQNPLAYDISVKGIRLVNIVNKGTYTFGAYSPKAGETAAKIDTAKWTPLAITDKNRTTNQLDYTKTGTAITLTSTAANVDFNTTTDANWMLIPQALPNWKYCTSAKDVTPKTHDATNTNNLSYISLLCKITTKQGSKVYPATVPTEGDRIDGYAWVAIPFGKTLELLQGRAYTLTINFAQGTDGKGGLGMVDPESPGDLDGDGDASNDAGKPIIPGTDPDDEDDEGAEKMLFSVSVDNWTDATEAQYPGGSSNKNL